MKKFLNKIDKKNLVIIYNQSCNYDTGNYT